MANSLIPLPASSNLSIKFSLILSEIFNNAGVKFATIKFTILNKTVFSLTTLSLNASTDLTCASLKAPNLVDSLENSLRASDPPPNIFISSAPRPPNISIANFVFIAPSSTLFKASATKPNKATWSFCIGKISA